eukprot:TRINITY_DN10044_c0_g1_i5.p1 TRINITY_DN10044_c0_g1~~TRINITY_DN10044_c0_g1_i5.p1  ORF type:complete len:186 (-),score=30.34 TRINITY_DN10044_c0_g1_i5:379-936(-)
MALPEQIGELSGHADRVGALAILPCGGFLVSRSADRSIFVWDLQAGQSVAQLQGHTGAVTALVGLGPRLAASADAGADGADGARAAELEGSWFASASADRTVRLWCVGSGEGREAAMLGGHRGKVMALAAIHGGHQLASASSDLTVKLWDLIACRELATLTGHTDVVCSLTALAVSMPKGNVNCS